MLTNRRRPPPHLETPEPRVALDTPKDPEVAWGACILYSLSLKVMIMHPALEKLGGAAPLPKHLSTMQEAQSPASGKTWLHPGSPRTQEVEVEDEKFKVNFSYIVNSRLGTLPHQVVSEGEEGGGGRRREVEGSGGGPRRSRPRGRSITNGQNSRYFPSACACCQHDSSPPALTSSTPCLLSQQLPSPLHNTG